MNKSGEFNSPSSVSSEQRLSALNDTKSRVIASGNAQAVFRRLAEIEEGRTANLSRWAWELLQNARDAAGTSGTVSVNVSFDGTKLTFEHDGPPFNDDEITHLIFHGTTKLGEHAGIGRFGTGFISTHLLSRVVRIRGPLDDGSVFDFELDRRGDDSTALQKSMERSWQGMLDSGRPHNGSDADRLTTFTYPIARETTSFVLQGLSELRRVAPLILAFNPQFSALKIRTDGETETFRLRQREERADVHELRIADGADGDVCRVIVVKREGVQVAIAVAGVDGECSILPADGMSRMYVAFPLMKTAHFPLRAAMNSEQFHPRTERDGIWLENDTSPQNADNRPRFERGCDAFADLVEYVARSDVADLPQLLVLSQSTNLESVDVEWLRKTIETHVVNDLSNRSVFRTRHGTLLAPQAAVIPFAEADKRDGLWQLCVSLKPLESSLPPDTDVNTWNDVIDSWSNYSNQPTESFNQVWTLERIVRHTAEAQTIVKLSERVDGDVWSWLSSLLNAMHDDDALSLAERYAILPNQKGELRTAAELKIDDEIPNELKELAELAGLSGRANLLASEMSACCYVSKLGVLSSEDFIEAIVDEIGDVEEEHRLVAVGLFGFVVKHRMEDWLERIPVLTAEAVPEMKMLKLDASPRERLLMPVSRWGNAKEFGELLPVEFVMHEDYAARLPQDVDWKWLADKGAIIESPLVTDSAHVEDFVSMMRKDPGHREAPRSTEPVSRTHIAYLRGKSSITERIRDSRRSGTLLVRFLLEFVVPNDANAFTEVFTECEDGEPRTCYGAAWLAELAGVGWVKGEKPASYVSAESLAQLLCEQPGIIKQLLKPEHAPLLKGLEVSAADLALRSVGKTETDRMSLIRSLGVIADAVGNDPARVERFALTVQADATLLQYIEQRGEFIERIAQNQSFGFAVEREFKAIFGGNIGVHIERTGSGHDFALSPIPGEENDAGRVEITSEERRIFVELKATRTSDAVHMSVRQVQTASAFPDRYWLCVVTIEDGEATSELVRTNARFICDIGSRLEDAWDQYEKLQGAIPPSADEDEETALEVSGHEVRFRVGHKLWATGISFDEAMKKLSAIVTPI